jgi:hypothetical protein
VKNEGEVILSAPWACGPPKYMKNKGGVILSEAKDPPAIGCKLQTANCKL